MKRITIKQCLLACFVLPMILAGCNDADYQVIDNAIYLNEASENGSAKVTVDPENVTTTTLTVRVGQPVTENVTAVLTVDPSILKEYNEANETSYEVLPEQYFTYDKEIKIAAGETLFKRKRRIVCYSGISHRNSGTGVHNRAFVEVYHFAG